jgi:hypothetical protein
MAAGARYDPGHGEVIDTGDPDQPVTCRLVASWSTTEAEVDRFLDILAG